MCEDKECEGCQTHKGHDHLSENGGEGSTRDETVCKVSNDDGNGSICRRSPGLAYEERTNGHWGDLDSKCEPSGESCGEPRGFEERWIRLLSRSERAI